MKKNTIAKIITFHCVPNYGAVLQAYALQSKLSEYIEQVSILDYRPKRLIKEYKIINTYSYKSIIFSIFSANAFLKKKEILNDLKKNIYLYQIRNMIMSAK